MENAPGVWAARRIPQHWRELCGQEKEWPPQAVEVTSPTRAWGWNRTAAPARSPWRCFAVVALSNQGRGEALQKKSDVGPV